MVAPFFPVRPATNPRIYGYTDSHPQYAGLVKVGYTTRDARQRVSEQYGVVRPGIPTYEIVLDESAMRPDGTVVTDREVHKQLRLRGIQNPDGEWFRCNIKTLKAAFIAARDRRANVENRTQTFAMRPEQVAAVEKTAKYFESFRKEKNGKAPHFLWNAKMRFGKTFTTYQLARTMGWQRVLVLTFKPAVENAWYEDLMTHVDFEGWQFVSPKNGSPAQLDPSRPFVCFGSFQDYLGRNRSTGGIKTKNEWVHETHWDCVVFDEYHYGAWRENAKDLFEADEDAKEASFAKGEGMEDLEESSLPIHTNHYLYLSGTPFRAIATGEFIEEQIYNWTYSDEQRAKRDWQGVNNPYAPLPRMVLMTYRMPDEIRDIALRGEFNEFDLNTFFSAEGQGKKAKFVYEDEVQKWLDLIRGAFSPSNLDDLRLGAQKPPLPFSDARLLSVLTHTFWFLPNVASCYAMANLLHQPQNRFYHDFKVIVAAGIGAGIGVEALNPVQEAMGDPLKTRTITLSCMKLTTGVTVKPWSGIFMLRNLSSPETYFQAAFRVQSPWTIKDTESGYPNDERILKEECYVFDFAPDRALRQIADYATRLDVNETNPEKKVAEFIGFLPVLAYDGSIMKQIDAAGILDIAMSGTSATLLARRWESALLVNVDNNTLKRLLDNEDALKALMNIEGFRALNQDLETIINKSEAVSKVKREKNDEELEPKEKKELTEQEKEIKSLRKQVQEKLIKFATRIPIFMYLTDYRERTLKDVITKLEPGLFKKVTGLETRDFEMLVSLGVFNSALMNDAVYKFKRYEDASLEYTGINKHEGQDIGLYDTVVTRDQYDRVFQEVSDIEYATSL